VSLDEATSIVFFAIAISMTIASVFGWVSSELIPPTILAILTALATNEIIRARETQNIKTALQKLGVAFDSFVKNSTKVSILNPDSFEDYVRAWGDYSDVMFAFNPTFEETSTIQRQYEQIIDEVYVKRYKDPNFKMAQYLFFMGDEMGRRQFDLFKRHLKQVEARTQKVRKKVTVRQSPEPCPACEFYLAKKWEKQHFVLEYRAKPIEEIRGKPFRVFAGWDDEMYLILRREFDIEWEKPENIEISVDSILE
jgi:hypothetical protein